MSTDEFCDTPLRRDACPSRTPRAGLRRRAFPSASALVHIHRQAEPRYAGLSKEVIEWANLRLSVQTFTHFLPAEQRLRVGRLDGRFKGPDPDGFMTTRFFDPTSAETGPPFTRVFNGYV